MTATTTTKQTTLDVPKVFAAIAAIVSRREGRQVRLVSVQKADKDVHKKAG